jgi:hypothetical protein
MQPWPTRALLLAGGDADRLVRVLIGSRRLRSRRMLLARLLRERLEEEM